MQEHTNRERERNLGGCDTTSRCCCWSTVRLLILSWFFVLLCIDVLMFCIAADGILVKGKNGGKREHLSSKKREKARTNDVAWTFAYTYVSQKKHLLLYWFVFLSFSCLLLFFWHFSSVFLSFSCPPHRRPYRCSSILELQYFLSVPCLLHCLGVWVMGEERERDDEGAIQWFEMLMCIYVCARR